MTLNAKLVQVARPSAVNSLAEGAVGEAWTVAAMGIDDVETATCTYILEPESLDDQEKVEGLLFAEGDLEALP